MFRSKFASRDVKYPPSTLFSNLPSGIQTEFIVAIRNAGRAAGKPESDVENIISNMFSFPVSTIERVARTDPGVRAVYDRYIGTTSYTPPYSFNDMRDRHPYEERRRDDSTVDLGKEIAITKVEESTDRLTKKQMYSTVVGKNRTMHKTYQEAVDKAINNLEDTLVYSHTQYVDKNNIVHSARDEFLGKTSKRYRDPKNMLGEERIWQKFNDDRALIVSASKKGEK